jgi:hypothetical protein
MRVLSALVLAIIFIAHSLVVIPSAWASPRYTAAKQSAERVKKSERDLARKFKKLTAAEKKRLKAAFRSTDSDSDGLSDILEEAIGSDLCERDSDGDGVDDSDDSRENEVGDDDDSDDSGANDGSNEVEVKSSIDSFDDPFLDVEGRRFTVTSDTVFRGTDFGVDDLEAGLCVEVKGVQRNGALVAVRIKKESPSECR